jgi:sulfur carrier protein
LHIQVNGDSQELPDGASLEDLVEKLSLPTTRIAIELNKNVARRADWAKTILVEGDRVEIVHFVGGGSINSDSAFNELRSSRQITSCEATVR